MTTRAGATDSLGLPSALEHFERIVSACDIGKPALDRDSERQTTGRGDEQCDTGRRRPCQRLCLFLDFDGTLAPIVPRPELAELPAPTRAVVEHLAALVPVCVVSGRALADLESKVGLENVYYVAEHGCELRPPGQAPSCALVELGPEDEATLARFSDALRTQLAGVPGLLIERKRLSTSFHYREMPPDLVPKLRSLLEESLGRHTTLVLREGKMVYEVRPAACATKGHAVLWLLRHWKSRLGPLHPLCLGDDLTDEDMFAAVDGLGTAILVGQPSRPSQARYFLRDPAEVAAFLTRLARHVASQGQGPHPS